MNRCRLYIHSVDRCYINMHVLCVYVIIFVYVSIFAYLITLCKFWCFLGTGCITEVDTTLQVQVGTSLNERCECFIEAPAIMAVPPQHPIKRGWVRGCQPSFSCKFGDALSSSWPQLPLTQPTHQTRQRHYTSWAMPCIHLGKAPELRELLNKWRCGRYFAQLRLLIS